MRKRSRYGVGLRDGLPVVTAALLAFSCGGEKTAVVEKPAVVERDGAELTGLMTGARRAVEENDANAFRALFVSDADARAVWSKLERLSSLQGRWHVERMMAAPGLERGEPGLHVERLYLRTWFDLTRETGRPADVYETSWEFARIDSAWGLRNIRLTRASPSYHALIRDMFGMAYAQYETLDMDWEKAPDPVPLLFRWLHAASAGDIEALESRSVAGVYRRAFEKNIDLPSLDDGDIYSGEAGRESGREVLEAAAAGIDDAYARTGLLAGGLVPYFGVYRVVSMPDDCTRLKVYTVFTDVDIPESDTAQFSTEWTAVYINHRWLVDDLAVKAIATGG